MYAAVLIDVERGLLDDVERHVDGSVALGVGERVVLRDQAERGPLSLGRQELLLPEQLVHVDPRAYHTHVIVIQAELQELTCQYEGRGEKHVKFSQDSKKKRAVQFLSLKILPGQCELTGVECVRVALKSTER